MLLFSLEAIVGILLILQGINLSLKKLKKDKELMSHRRDETLVYKNKKIVDWVYWSSVRPTHSIGIYMTMLGIMCLVHGAHNVLKILNT
jgi:uncharacterized membrane protein HdeD (DUF308 family)